VNEVVTALLSVEPTNPEALELLARLQADAPTLAEVIELGPAITGAIEELDALAERSREMVKRCERITALPSNSVPIGF
jgi:hypothetical protein